MSNKRQGAAFRGYALWLTCALAALGTVPAAAQAANEIVLHSFASWPKGASPYSGVIGDSAGNLYGTAEYGGASGAGVVYKLDPAGHITVLYSFTGGADGGKPTAGVIRDPAGNLYGSTGYSGIANMGVVYKLDTAGHQTVLHSFTGGADGGNPSDVIRDSAGNLYGTTMVGGTANVGVVFKLDAEGQETVLHTFTGGTDGTYPTGVVRDSAGNLYGAMLYGGTYGFGLLFKLDTAGQLTVLYNFSGGGYDGCMPSSVILGSAGNLYGVGGCGANGRGVVYEVNAAGQETVLHNFTGGTDGGSPDPVNLDAAGNLYGTTVEGGSAGDGVVYKLDPSGNQTVLYNFTGHSGGRAPYAGVIRDSAGNLYGTTTYGGTLGEGMVYKLDSTNHLTLRYSFPASPGGTVPGAGVIRDSAGNLYGTTEGGGKSNAGVVYRVDTAGQTAVLYTFTGGTDGNSPRAGVIGDQAGNLYGTTLYGGTAGKGVIYKLDSAGNETALYSFQGGADGSYPESGLIRDSAGNLYGTTQVGSVYRLDASGNLTALYDFSCGPACSPYSGLIRDSSGNLYGTSFMAGSGNSGEVYKLDASGNMTVLYSFTGGPNGYFPYGGVIADSAGNLYGTTFGGGASNAGVVYKLEPTGQLSVLYSFNGGANGGNPEGGVIMDSAGNLYGTLAFGASGAGLVYKLDMAGNQTVLYSFSGGADGDGPNPELIIDAAGNLYGTTVFGGQYGTGPSGSGVVFKIEPL